MSLVIPFSQHLNKFRFKQNTSSVHLLYFTFLHTVCHNFDILPTYFLNTLLISCFDSGPSGILQLWIILGVM